MSSTQLFDLPNSIEYEYFGYVYLLSTFFGKIL